MHEVMNEILNFIGYLIPGYIGMFVYEMVRSTKMRNFSRVWGSLMVSFVAIKVLKWAFPSIGDKFGVLLMGACGISIIGGFALATFANNERVQDLLSRYFHFSTTNTILEEVIRTSSPGSVMRVYLKGRDFYVEGAVHSYNNTKDDEWVSLSYYSLFKRNEQFAYTSPITGETQTVLVQEVSFDFARWTMTVKGVRFYPYYPWE